MPSLILPRSRFIHVPKTGGCWVHRLVLELGLPHAHYAGPPGWQDHSHLVGVGLPLWTWGFVRSPWTWYPSQYRHHLSTDWRWCPCVTLRTWAGWMDWQLTHCPYVSIVNALLPDPPQFVGRFERLEHDVRSALVRSGDLDEDAQLPRLRVVNRSRYRPTAWTEELVERVREADRDVFERWGSPDSPAESRLGQNLDPVP